MTSWGLWATTGAFVSFVSFSAGGQGELHVAPIEQGGRQGMAHW
jgi:hypothetical protein